ncbi:lipopolysaccharide kinase InaA family protein [Geobacter sp.]|uniref:lipopolysaccharide kinase InaA family protein n=1 Tax=Geobacter sp. TaxID=46610 RepID=UPI0027B8CB19|nr:lipopolysaccharide kinase InaA family protein [Geobacter sp.]
MRFAVNTIQWNLDHEVDDTTEMELFSSFDRVFEMDGEIVSGGQFCETIRVVAGGRDYYVKRYRAQGKHRWKALGRSRPITEYRNLTYFSRMDIPVPRIVGYGSQSMLGLFRRGAIITEGVHQATDLQTLIRTQPALFHNRPWLLQVLRSLADYVRRIHEDGFTHGDLKWRNILATTTETPRVFFIDCPSGSRKLPLRHRHFLVKDLASLDRLAAQHLSRTTRLRFYLWYRNQTHLTNKDKELIAKVLSIGG